MRRIHFVPALVVGLMTIVLAAAPASAAQLETIFLDFDNNPATGCNDPVSGFQGYNQRVVTTVETSGQPDAAIVTRIQGFDCSNTQVFLDETDHPVGIGNGYLGLNVIETYWPMASLSPPSKPCKGGSQSSHCIRLGAFAQAADGGTDTLFTSNGKSAGDSALLVLGGSAAPSEIPTVSEWGLLGLALLLAAVAALKLRRRPRALLSVLLVLAAGGVAYAVVFDLDGTTLHEWSNGHRIAHDAGAQDDGDDIGALYARADVPTARVYFRIDASLVFNTPPVVTTTSGATSFVEDGGAVVVDSGVTVTDADSASLASATVTITNPQNGALETLAASACAGLTVTPGLHSLSISGSQPPATYQTCLRSVTYDNASNTPGTTARVVVFVANDGIVASAPGNKTVSVTATNDVPVVTTTAGDSAFNEDGGPVVVDGGVTVTDLDNGNLASATVTITNPQDGTAETLTASACAGLTLAPGTNTLAISGSQPLATYQTCLRSVTYDNSDQDPGTTPRVISFVADDGTASSVPANKTVTVAAANDAPVVNTTAGSTAFAEGGGAVVIDAGVAVTDADSAQLLSATVTITNVQDVGFESLAATACAGLTVAGSGTPTLAISGSQPVATYQACLRSVTYDDTDQDPDATARVISFVANDGTSSSSAASKTVTVAALNDAPVVTTTAGSTSFTEDGGAVVVDAGVTVTDVDHANLASATVSITNVLDGGSEQLAATACGALTVGGTGTATLTITGSQPLATYQTCLQSVTYDDTDQDPDTTPRVISFVANDGADSSAPATRTVTVAAVQDAPVVTTSGGSTAFTEAGGAVAVDSAVTLTDADSANLASATVSITNVQDSGFESLAAPACGGLTVGGIGTPTLTITGSQSPATYQTCLRSVTYDNSDLDPATTTRVISFAANDGALASTPATKSVTVTAVNDAPVVTTTAGTTAFVEDAGAVVVDGGVTVADADNSNLASATVTITNVQDGGSEGLAATACGALIIGGTGTATLTITGNQSPATYQSCLRSVTYDNGSQSPSTTPRVITFVANDGALASTPATRNVSVAAVNDAPVVTTTAGATSFSEDGGAVIVDSGVGVADADDANLASATVSITNVQDSGFESLAATACGALSIGGSGTATLTISGSQPLTVYQTCLRSVTYDNADQEPTAAPARTIRFIVNDGTTNSNNGDKTVSVTAVNDSPTVTTTAGPTTFTEDAGPVVVDGGVSVADADNANLASATVSITNVQDGGSESLNATACGFLTVGGVGTATLTLSGNQSKAVYQACLQSVTYNNSDPAPTASPSRVVSFVVNDGASSSAVATKAVVVIPVNDAPVCAVNPVTYATAGNTLLEVGGATLPAVARVSDPQSLLAKSLATDADGPGPISVVAVPGNTGGGDWIINADGSFTFISDAGFTGTATRSYQVADSLGATATCTVNVAVTDTVWYVRDIVDASNPLGGDGRSTDAFETLSSAQAPSTDDDYIYVFEGDTATTPQVGGFALKNGQKLWGQGVALSLPGHPGLVAAANQARIRTTAASTNTVNVPATAGSRQNVEIRGLDLEATGATSNAIDVTSSGANAVSVTISDNNVRGATAEGIDLNAGATAALVAAVQNNSITATGNGLDTRVLATGTAAITAATNAIVSSAGNAFDARTSAGATALQVGLDGQNVAAAGDGIAIDGSAGGTTTITAFANNVVAGSTVGTGVIVTSAVFDTVVGNPITQVAGGTTVIGASGNGVGANGIVLTSVRGDLAFSDLDIFNEGGVGLSVASTGSLNAGAGTGFRISVPAAVATIDASGGPAVNVNNASVNLPLQFMESTNSATSGLSLVNAFGGAGGTALSVGSGPGTGSIVDPAGASGAAVSISGGSGNITIGVPITNTSGNAVAVAGRTSDTVSFTNTVSETGSGISLTNNTGATIAFGGSINASTGPNAAFTATGGGTVTASDTASTLTTTTGTALNVANTTIGAAGLKFRSISAGTATSGPTSGIVLDNTGALGSLTVLGTGAADSGGTIQRTTSHGISLTTTLSPSFTSMRIQNTGGSGIEGTGVTNFTLANSTIDNSGTGGGIDDSNVAFNNQAAGTENNLAGVVSITNNTLTNARWHGIMIQNFDGTISDATVTGNTITSSTSAASSFGYGIKLQILGSSTTSSNLTKATISGNTVSNFPSAGGIQVQGGNSNAAGPSGTLGVAGSGANVISIVNNQVRGQSAANRMATSAILYTVSGKGQGNVDISSNGTLASPIGNNSGHTIGVGANGNTTLTATTNNNFVEANHPGTTGDSGISGGVGVTFGVTDVADMTWTINGNTIRNVDGNGILAVARGTNGALKVKIQNNDVEAPQAGVRPGIRIDAGNTTAGTDNDVCLNISGNTSAGSGGSQGIGLRKQGTVTTTHAFGVNGMVATSSPGVETYVNGLNPAGNSTLLISATSGFSNCSLP